MDIGICHRQLDGLVTTSSEALTGAFTTHTNISATANSSSTSDGASDNPNPYAIITDRNIFHLNPLPPPPVVEEKPVDVPKVYLNGIIKVGDNIRVLFSIPQKDAKSQTSYFKLAPGERATGESDNVLELLRIHPDQQDVDVVVNGTVETLSVLSNSMPSTGGKRRRCLAASACGCSSSSQRIVSVFMAGGGGRKFLALRRRNGWWRWHGEASIGGNNSTSLGGSGGSNSWRWWL